MISKTAHSETLHSKPKKNSQNSDSFVDLGIASGGSIIKCDNLKDYSKEHEFVDEKSSFVNVAHGSGEKIVRKSSLMWNLSTSKEKLSSDRLRRVRGSSMKNKARRRLEFFDVSVIDQPIYIASEMKIGDWCVFKNTFEEKEKSFMLGNILSVRYIDGKTNKEKKYLLDFIPINKDLDNEKSREMELMASWYQMKFDGTVPTFKFIKNSFVCMKFYVANLSRHIIQKDLNETIFLSKKDTKTIENFLQFLK